MQIPQQTNKQTGTRDVPDDDDDEVEAVPAVPEVRPRMHHKAVRDYLQRRLHHEYQ